jgi:hypothetical protein
VSIDAYRHRLAFAAAWGLAICVAVTATAPDATALDVIFDTDIGGDVDDVLALGLIHALESRGECRLLAVTITKNDRRAATLADAVNTFYGRGEVPIGIVTDGPDRDPGTHLSLGEVRDDGRLRYASDVVPAAVPDAVSLLRRTLADRPDGSVVMIQVGLSTNLARLLRSDSDEACPLDGRELVARKVRLLSIMAGWFQPVKRKIRPEYNVVADIASARTLAAEWPTPIVWSGYEIGTAMRYPQESIDRDYGYVAHHPLPEAYRLGFPRPHDRPTWDLTSVLYAVRPDRGYFGLGEPGRVTIDDRGMSTFEPSPDGRHRLLTATGEQAIRCREAFIGLCSEPPSRRSPVSR